MEAGGGDPGRIFGLAQDEPATQSTRERFGSRSVPDGDYEVAGTSFSV